MGHNYNNNKHCKNRGIFLYKNMKFFVLMSIASCLLLFSKLVKCDEENKELKKDMGVLVRKMMSGNETVSEVLESEMESDLSLEQHHTSSHNKRHVKRKRKCKKGKKGKKCSSKSKKRNRSKTPSKKRCKKSEKRCWRRISSKCGKSPSCSRKYNKK